MEYELRDGSTAQDPRLDRLVEFDERSREFPIMKLLTTEERDLRSYSWNKSVWLDQGQEGACVGFSLSQELAARPVIVRGMTNEFARNLYFEIQKRDPWQGGAYPGANPHYEGTSVLSGLKYIKELGYIGGYSWAFSERELAVGVSYKGPAILGIPWYREMFKPDGDGFVHARGELMGYHAILCSGLSLKLDAYRLDNSWGTDWGFNGSCYVSRADMRNMLLPNDGEAAILTQRKQVKI